MVEAERGRIETPTHRTALSIVNPVNIHVDRLSVHVNSITGGWLAPMRFLKQKLGGTQTGMQNQILHDVSVTFPSGSGKTTLLNILCNQRSARGTTITGDIFSTCSGDIHSIRSAYLRQNDFLIPSLTVRETLQTAADLRMPSGDAAYRSHVVDQLISGLGLMACADTRIGEGTGAGCSGGERRRTSLGVQILANPSCLFCDEPTTGLDAANAYHIVQLLKDLAGEGRTVVVAIHTPRPEIWELFDHVLLLSQGHVLYNGPSSSVRGYFQQCGHSIPEWKNPAEVLIDLVSVEAEADAVSMVSVARINNLKERWKAAQCTIVDSCRVYPCSSSVVRHASSTSRNPLVSLSRQLDVLTRRTIRTTLRGPMSLFGSLSITIVLGIVTGAAFYQVDSSAQGLWSRQGALFSLLNIYGYPLLVYEIFRLSYEIRMFDREREDGVISVAAFLISRRLARLALEDIPGPAISFVVFYFLVGLWGTAAEPFLFLLVLVLATYISLTAAVLAIAISRDFAIAGLIGNLLYTLQSLSRGYLVHVDQISLWVRWSKWIAHNFYLYSALCAIEFVGPEQTPRGHLYSCSTIANSSTGGCTESYGKDIMTSLGFPREWIWQPIVASFGFLIFYTMVAALLLQRPQMGAIMTPDPQLSRSSDIIRNIELQPLTSTPWNPGVDIRLNKFALSLTRRNLKPLGSRGHERPILKPINTTFKQGELSVIMGPSGSGKTTLIHAITARLPQRYRRQGQILYNSDYLPPSTIRTMCSYVSQSDHLQSFLTVRETLLFAAGLRLPGWMTKEQRYSKVDSIIHKMGLTSCAGTIVGDDKQKGISGGEQRRVSIGIQLLTDPRVLILDEPTSGLDAYTAGCILKKLKDLSEEGRTVVCSLLQSIIIYPGERDTFKSERKDGCMTAICFLVQYTCLELPTEVFTALISGAIFTFGPPIQGTLTMFFILSFNIFAIINCGISTTLAPIMLYINWVFAGLLSTSLPRVFQVVAYILPSKYVMANILPYAMHGLEFTCSEEQQPGKQCTIEKGKDVLDFYNFDKNPGLNLMGLAVCVIVYRAVALRYAMNFCSRDPIELPPLYEGAHCTLIQCPFQGALHSSLPLEDSVELGGQVAQTTASAHE
ncbi:ATP-binding cassette transporter [Aspergillus bombycis]|uniref:ATP-binding cassette transporter n=1 Tax=Aspergillus bombycis TaxID=109264 RepID=A0A1F8A8J9_9EURO|nr:ATP-binding cassette transporter [Aspergillus bombycis]OGM48017.1 ATP-binding cassette transporter [Aspergillus bombycis]